MAFLASVLIFLHEYLLLIQLGISYFCFDLRWKQANAVADLRVDLFFSFLHDSRLEIFLSYSSETML